MVTETKTAKRRTWIQAGLATIMMVTLSGCGWGSSKTARAPDVDIGQSARTSSVFSMPRIGFGDYRQAGIPDSEAQCRRRLKRLGVSFTPVPSVREGSCGIDYPLEIETLARGVKITPAATLNCQAALAAAEWLQGDAGPAARVRYLTGIAEIRNASSYSCRKINGTNQWSEHSKGNALDIGSIKLKNGRVIDVAKPGFFAMRERGYLKTIRASACDRFTTVMGPGSNADHADHFHFDLRQRKSGYRHCD